ncbi:phytoene/squalene synthase family protein [Pelagibacterium xiamenense]|uniref:phytoene/squalene synthase family protein n=1 Tax=Pelagibacterium xiamenense TaxID=2901140 RepID=UPI001E5A71CA|nr:phytoene/squalene synthase family protein [Pelagibacterium xiamenense]MCD7061046.1 phytoene/squalene synthase family protein [Pelagibacterium xiamenense]
MAEQRQSESLRHAADALRSADPDRYAATLIVPPVHRPSVQALYAFAAEVAGIRERVSEPTPGEIRLQWWVDALEGKGHGEVLQNPIADALLDTLATYDLPAGPLVRLLAARRFDLYHDPMTDMGQFEGYAGETTSILYQYAAMILSGGSAETAADASGHLGVAQALSGHMKAFGFNAARAQIFLPLQIFTAHGVTEKEIYAGSASDRMAEALAQIGDIAREHAEKARSAIGALPKSVRPAFAPIALVEADLTRLERDPLSVLKTLPQRSPLGRLSRLIWWGLRNG